MKEVLVYELSALAEKLRGKFAEADRMARAEMEKGNLEKAQALTCRAGGFLDAIGVLEAEISAFHFDKTIKEAKK